MTNHPIRRCHCLEVYQRAGEVDGLDMAVSVKSWPPVLVRGLVCSRRHSQESIHLDRNIFNSNISSGSIASVGGIHFFLPPRPKLASHNISFHLNHFFWPNFSSPCVPHLTRTDKFPEKKNSYSRVPGSIGLFGKLTICVMELDTSWCSWGGGGKISGLYGSAPGNEPLAGRVDDTVSRVYASDLCHSHHSFPTSYSLPRRSFFNPPDLDFSLCSE